MPKFLKIFKKKKSRIPASLPEKTAEPVKPIENVKKVEESSHSKVQPEQTAETVKPAENIANVKKVEEPSNSEGGTEQTGAIIEKSTNAAFQEAWKQHWNDLSENERKAWSFQDVRSSLQVHQAIEDIDKLHREQSVARRIADRTLSFLQVVESLMAGATIGIQAYAEVSSIVFGVIRLVIDAAVKYFEYYEKLTKMMEDIADLLKALRAFAEIKSNEPRLHEVLVSMYTNILSFCRHARRAYLDQDKGKNVSALAVFARVQWAPFEAQFGKIQADLRRQTENLNIISNAIIIKSTSILQEDMVKKNSLDAQNERRDFLEWVSQADMNEIHKIMSKKRYKNTGSWLLEKPSFKSWISGAHKRILWLQGPAGTGKTILSSVVINHLNERSKSTNDPVLYAYFKGEDTNIVHTVQMMSSLVKQLCWELHTLPDSVIKLYRDFSMNARRFSSDDLNSVFSQCSMLFGRVFIILDGLDECEEKHRKQILKFICETGDRSENVNIFVASRSELDILHTFRRHDTYWLSSKDDLAQKDLEAFVKHRVETELKHVDSDLRKEVTKTLIENSKGMYLWVDLQLNDLARVPESDIGMQLKVLPAELEDTYLSMFLRMTALPKTTKSLIQTCFLWAFNAKELLPTTNFQDAVALKHKMSGKRKNPYDGRILEEVTFGLLSIQVFAMVRVRPIHFSLKEFAIRPSKNHPPELQEILPDSETADAKMAIMCIQHLLVEVEPVELFNTCLGYCAQYFDTHIQSLTTIPKELWDILDHVMIKEPENMKRILRWKYPSQFLDFPYQVCVGNPKFIDPTMFMRCTRLHQIPSIWSRYRNMDETTRAYPKNYIYLAAWCGLVDILSNIVAQGIDVDKPTRDGHTALFCTLEPSNPENKLACMEILLNAGASWSFTCSKMQSKICTNPDVMDESPLTYAINHKHYSAVQLIVKHESFNFANFMKTIPQEKCEEYIKYLVQQAGADINQRDEYGDTALTVAKEDGREDCVKILEELGAVE